MSDAAPPDTVVWTRGGAGSVEAAQDVHVRVWSSVAYPPGAPAEGTLTGPAGEALRFTLKVQGSRRLGERWVVTGRLISATAALKLAFAARVAPRAPA